MQQTGIHFYAVNGNKKANLSRFGFFSCHGNTKGVRGCYVKRLAGVAKAKRPSRDALGCIETRNMSVIQLVPS